jgi:hypothetical protein
LVTCLALFVFAGAVVLGQPARADEREPDAEQPKQEDPSTDAPLDSGPQEALEELAKQPIPDLVGTGEEAQKNALAFIDWAASSTLEQADLVRRAVAEARDNRDIATTFCDEAFTAQAFDHARALVILALLGEMQSEVGTECLRKFVDQPLPERGTEIDGEILERTAMETLQAKAIDGLAYLRDPDSDKVVLNAISAHPSRIVRAEAIAAYLWNHADDPRASDTLLQVVRKDELIFLDRVVREQGEQGEAFNEKLEAYLKSHPELLPPPLEERDPDEKLPLPAPPDF